MRAMLLDAPHQPLRLVDLPQPQPDAGQLLLRVEACGVCRTDLHLLDGELPDPTWPIVPGHEIVGRIAAIGFGVSGFSIGQRIGVPWLGWTCGKCEYCLSGHENLCDAARFTGYQLDGGYAEYTLVDQRYALPLPDNRPAAELAPLLCAGLIGYRTLRMAGAAQHVGIYGFGAAAHILAQLLRQQQRPFYAFTRPGDLATQRFALQLGAAWAGASDAMPPHALDAALIFAAAGELVPQALRMVKKGGTVVCGGIHMSDIPAFPYQILWGERTLKSVANLTRADGLELLQQVALHPVSTHIQCYPLQQANQALADLRHGRIRGAAVLQP